MNTSKIQNHQVAIGRSRDRSQTAAALKAAFVQLKDSHQRVSISAVASAVSVTPALIHNKYPDIAEAIRQHTGKATRTKRNETRSKLAEAQDCIRGLRNDKKDLEADVRKLASINESLRRQLLDAQAIANAKNVVVMASRRENKPKK